MATNLYTFRCVWLTFSVVFCICCTGCQIVAPQTQNLTGLAPLDEAVSNSDRARKSSAGESSRDAAKSTVAFRTRDVQPASYDALKSDDSQEQGAVEPDVGSFNPLPPSELSKTTLPRYRLEPPDVLLIDALRMAPKDPYHVKVLDVMQVVVLGAFPDQPIAGYYQVEPDGRVNLGPSYGSVAVDGLSLEEAMDAIRDHLSLILEAPEVSVTLAQLAGQQQIAGEHLIGPDGTVNLGVFGSVYIAGMTLDEAKQAIEDHLSESLHEPEVSIDVFSYNSKVYYIIAEGGGFGDSFQRFPITGNETVLDALSQVGGLSRVSSTKIWIARPTPLGVDCHQILPVDIENITRGAVTATNYQILPGDRIFIAEDRLIALDNAIAKLTQPVERLFGVSLLGAQTIQILQRFPKGFRQTW